LSTDEFVLEILEKNKEEIEEIRKLQEALDQLRKPTAEAYIFSVTSNL
jgi:hypothetical protein